MASMRAGRGDEAPADDGGAAQQAAAPPSDAPFLSPNGQGAGPCVLVVDDDQPVRAVLARLLRSRGYVVFQAGNAHEAQVEVEVNAPDAVITDIVMPGESGIELRRTMLRRWPAIPVILISGYSAEAPAEFAVRSPRTWFMQKPFRAEQLLALVDEALGGHVLLGGDE